MKKFGTALLIGILSLGLLSCSGGTSESTPKDSSTAEKKTTIKIGTHPVSRDLANSGVAELEKLGYKVEIVQFEDYVLPNDSLVEGSTDANLYQHEPYMINYNNSNKSDIVMLSPKLYNYYVGFYSDKATSVESLPEGGIVGIATDAANIDNDLRHVQEAGVIKLTEKPTAGDFYTVADIEENPKKYEFRQSDHTKYLNIDDYVFYIGTSNTMATAGVDPTKNQIKKFTDNEYALGMSTLEKNKDSDWAKDIMKAYTSQEAISNVPASSGFEPYMK